MGLNRPKFTLNTVLAVLIVVVIALTILLVYNADGWFDGLGYATIGIVATALGVFGLSDNINTCIVPVGNEVQADIGEYAKLPPTSSEQPPVSEPVEIAAVEGDLYVDVQEVQD